MKIPVKSPVKLSIIIPTYNEEKNLEILLKSVKKQSFKDYEVIVADADSKDKTVKVAKTFGCKVVKGGLPAKGRNNGTKIAKGDIFLFLDADTKLPKYFLKKNLNEFIERDLDVAGVDLIPLSNLNRDYLIHGIYNSWQRLMQKIDSHLSGACIFIKRKVFFNINGFDEDLMVAEDHALARKAKKKNYNFGILNQGISLSVRRLKKEGRFNFAAKLFFFWFRRLFGEIKNSKIKYNLRRE